MFVIIGYVIVLGGYALAGGHLAALGAFAIANPIHAIQNVADGLPAFGIVAAVMGAVHTMSSVGRPGEMIAHPLVGTFLTSLQGYAPPIAIEFRRKVLYSTERPSFAELGAHVKQQKS